MGKLSIYKIPLRGLSEGKHEFNYKLDNKFFTLFDDEDSDIKKGDLDVALIVKNTSTTFEMNFEVKGAVYVPCDRCLDTMTMEVSTTNRLIVKFGSGYSEESDEIVIIPEEDGEINIAWFLYEFITLSLPIKHVHPAGMCNKAMSSKLNKHKVKSTDDTTNDDGDDSDELDSDADTSFNNDSNWDSFKELNVED